MTINFGNEHTQIFYRWSDWKTIYSLKKFEPQYFDDGNLYLIYGYDGPDVHYCQIYKNTVPNSSVGEYSQAQNDLDKNDFEVNVKATCNQSIEKKQIGNKAKLVALTGREGNETIYCTHNFCDPTSWFGDSIRTTEVLSGSGTIFSSSYINWIDMAHGNILDEDGFREDVEHGYDIIVVAAGVTRSMREPFTSSGGDYTVNYQSGSIEFVNGTYSQNEVTASFSYENGSTFYITPYPYKKLDVEEVEAQFTKNVIMKDTIIFGVFGYVQDFAPQYWEGNGGPLPTNYKIELKRQSYKTLKQLIDEALGSYPIIPAIGGADRGLSNEMYGFPFRYSTIRSLNDAQGLEIRVWLQNDTPHEGERVTATFYCVSSDE